MKCWDIGNKETFNLSKLDNIGIFEQSMNDWLMELQIQKAYCPLTGPKNNKMVRKDLKTRQHTVGQ